MNVPVLAVVGHPNKGKSSVVSTLALTDAPEIAPDSGTTRHSMSYTVKVDDQPVYALVDTPGFQRARGVLNWIDEQAISAADQPDALRRFVDQHAGEPRFADECELLRPIVEGAAILYVVDGSRPYGEEYDAEIELLRRSGQPIMALINPIDDARFVEPWREALERRLNTAVHQFNPMTAQFGQCIELLEAFGHLRGSWREPIQRAVVALKTQRQQQHDQAAHCIARLLGHVLNQTTTRRVEDDQPTDAHESELRQRLRQELAELEAEARREVEAAYGHRRIARQEAELLGVEGDLFSREVWLRFGLSRRQLAEAGAAGGAVVGAVVDANLGGASLLAGALIGAVAGGVAGYFGAGRLARTRVSHLRLGETRLICGPVRDVQFAFVLLNRALTHQHVVAERRHAVRSRLELDDAKTTRRPTDALDAAGRRQLGRLFKQITNQRDVDRRREIEAKIAERIEPLVSAVDRAVGGPATGRGQFDPRPDDSRP